MAPTVADAWRALAACRGMGPALFYPPGDAELPAAAAAVCATCPVAAPCLAESLSTNRGEDFGVWAGTTPPERRRMRLPRSA